MTKLLIVVTLIVVLIATYCSSETYNIKVGSPEGKSVYDPPTVNVNLQDIVLWEWVSGVHTVVQSDTPKSCQKSISTTAFTPSPILNEAGKTFQITITEPGSGKLYYFSNQGTDCIDAP
ncbi:13518_t:CDS:2 [Entrophospora sp. SA101]|nr:13518_t:CDS:2 [Entrophospora sp. SA101]